MEYILNLICSIIFSENYQNPCHFKDHDLVFKKKKKKKEKEKKRKKRYDLVGLDAYKSLKKILIRYLPQLLTCCTYQLYDIMNYDSFMVNIFTVLIFKKKKKNIFTVLDDSQPFPP